MRINPEQGTEFAKMLVAEEDPLADLNQVSELDGSALSLENAMSHTFDV